MTTHLSVLANDLLKKGIEGIVKVGPCNELDANRDDILEFRLSGVGWIRTSGANAPVTRSKQVVFANK